MSEQDDPVVDASALAGNPFERKSTWRSAIRGMGSRAWAAAALAVGVLVLGWHLRPTTPVDEAIRESPDGITRLTAADPRALRQQVVAELRAAGIDATGYEQLGINGVDADLPRPITADARRVLEQHQIPLPATGALRLEISRAETR